jgi:serine/threonine protein kinase/formylglycine-generating enzyme required for sulfatase activity
MEERPQAGAPAPRTRLIRFGPFEFEARTGELRKHRIKIRLQEQPCQILVMLLEHPGDAVLREEIRKKLWPNDTVVEFDHSINAAIKKLREALGDSAEDPRYIETLARRGYRFIGIVESAGPALHDQTAVAKGAEPAPSVDPSDLSGQTLSHFRVIEKLGSGGMGVVYRAEDLKLNRQVALKFLPLPVAEASPQMRERFRREARAASALNHPNICTIYGLEEFAGQPVIVMELVEGEPLTARLAHDRLTLEQALTLAVQVAGALDVAHRKGIVHRDLKPSNLMVDARDHVKVLDFGLAKLTEPSTDESAAGAVFGTVAYMSPEQAEGKPVDARSDIFSFGLVLYEMVTGHRAFEGESAASILAALMREDSRLPAALAKDAPNLANIIDRCLRKGREARFASMDAVLRDLEDCRSALAKRPARHINLKLLSLKVAIPALMILLLTAGGAWVFERNAHIRWAKDQGIPEIASLIEEEKFTPAFTLAERAEKYIPSDPALIKLWRRMASTVTIHTTPPGAEIRWQDYDASDGHWEHLGLSPLENVRVPRGLFRWKIEKRGFATIEGSLFPSPFDESNAASIILDEEGKRPAGMVRVSAGNQPTSLDIPGYEDVPPVPIEDYWIDRYEVTNKQFKEFVDYGGYRKPEYWKQEFRKNGSVISWIDAMALFHDATGRPGPAGWVQSDYPGGQDDYPVSGVSWYEAAAYAEFAGKILPTIWHWSKAAGIFSSAFVAPASNFNGRGPARVGSYHGLGRWGTYDMGGNVKEWCWNQAAPGLRYILGGGWDEPGYMFEDPDMRSPLERAPNFGFRCAKYFSPSAVSKAATDPLPSPARDYSREKPVSDELFRAYRSLYSYDKSPLHAAIESVDERNESWKREKITFDAAYGNERVIAYLFLPRRLTPPLETVVFFPASGVIRRRSSADLSIPESMIDFMVKSGRAVLYPIYKGTYERGDALNSDIPNTTSFYRDHVIDWSKDLGRSIDYLETRPEIDRDKIAYFGFSWGGYNGPIIAAIETRIKVCVFFGWRHCC